jgi:iron(III) transport system substrate-binding protein
MDRTARTLVGVALVGVALVAGLAACSAEGGPAAEDADLVVYSGRAEEQVGPLVEKFEEATGSSVSVRYGDTAELAVQLLEEGAASPADVFWAQDAGALSAVDDEGLLAELPVALLQAVPPEYRASEGRWVGTSGRARVYAYNPDTVSDTELPDSIFELTGPTWRDRVAIAPTNASFQAFVTAMRVSEGEDATRQWLADLKANGAVAYEANTYILDAVDAGEIDLGLINHYYWFQKAAEVGEEAMTAQLGFFASGDPGSLVNVAGVGVLRSAAHADRAAEFAEFLLTEDGQKYFVDVTKEYPLVRSVEAQPGLPRLSTLEGPDVPLSELADLEGTLAMLTETGWI